MSLKPVRTFQRRQTKSVPIGRGEFKLVYQLEFAHELVNENLISFVEIERNRLDNGLSGAECEILVEEGAWVTVHVLSGGSMWFHMLLSDFEAAFNQFPHIERGKE